MVPSIKIKYDYGVMIFILTFNLVAVYGFRAKDVIDLACDRLLTIAIGFAVCILISFFFFPVWAGDELYHSLASKFDILASSLEGLLYHSALNMFDLKIAFIAYISACHHMKVEV